MPLILGTNSIKDTAYNVDNSLRFNKADAPKLERTFGTATNRKIWTLSMWVKRSSTNQAMLLSTNGASSYYQFQSGGAFEINDVPVSTYNYRLVTNAIYRDMSAWMHIVIAFDSTQSTDSDRIKLYINGEQPSLSVATYPNLNFEPRVNNAEAIKFGSYDGSTDFALDGYLCEIAFVDGSQLDATSFGEFDSNTGIWKPIDVSGLTFGNNGFYLDFENSGSLGADVSGNGNNFTVNNLTSIDQTTDTPTNNYCTMNPLVFNTSTGNTFAEGNLQVSTTDSAVFGAVSSIGVSSGKWYMEVKPTQIENKNALGITSSASDDARNNTRPGTSTNSVGIRSSGDVQSGGSSVSGSWDSFTTSDIVGIALDLDNNNLYFSKNGTFMNSADPTSGATGTGAISLTDPASTTDGFYFFAFGDPGAGAGTSNIAQFNFGSPPYTISSGNSDGNGYGNFEYAVPSGYYSLNTKNLSEFG